MNDIVHSADNLHTETDPCLFDIADFATVHFLKGP